MYLQYQYVGTKQDLHILLNQTIRGFVKVRSKIPTEIIQYFPNESDHKQIIDNINQAIKNCADLIKRSNDSKVNLDHLAIGLRYIRGTLLENYMNILNEQKFGKRMAAQILKQDARLMAVNRMFNQMIQSQNGFATLKKRHDNYKKVLQAIQFVKVSDATQVEERMKKFGSVLSMTNASVIESYKYDSKIIRSLLFPINFVRYFFDFDQAEIIVSNHLRKPNAELMQNLWNVGQKQFFVSTGMNCMLPRIRMVEKLFFARQEQNNLQLVDIYTQDESKIPVRFICPNQIQLFQRSQLCGCLLCKGCSSCIPVGKQNIANYETIMIHIHGGGFVSLSSFSMQNHTRRWANDLNIPVFSIDYRLSPQSVFPDALEDCKNVYLFLVNHIFKYMNIKPKKIILSGDSAGGNLCLALTALLIKRNIHPLPYGLFLAYPATDFRQKFSPSRLYSLNDTLLFTTLLFICRQAYIGDSSDADPLVSPILITQGWINGNNDARWPLKWPKTRMIVGQKDPLFDDSFQLLQKMVMSKIDIKCLVYEGMGHGILNLQTLIPQCSEAVTRSIEQLKQLLQ